MFGASTWRRRLVLAAAALGLLSIFINRSGAQEPAAGPTTADLEKRIQELETIVRQLQAERRQAGAATAPPQPIQEGATAPAAPVGPAASDTASEPIQAGSRPAAESPPALSSGGRPGPGPTPLETAIDRRQDVAAPAGWANAFFLQSPDKKYILRITGQLQSDYRSFLDGNDTADIDSFLVRRARLGIEANLLEYYEFRLLPDFSNQQAPGTRASTVVQDAYMNVHYVDWFQVETGKFKQPFSYEQLIQDRFVPTMERSMIDQLVPARDEGVMIHGKNLLGKRLDYGVSISNGEINGDFDANDRKDWVGRVVLRPFGNDDSPELLRHFQFGISGSLGVEQQPIASATSALAPNTLRTPATIPWFKFNSIAAVGGGVSNIVIADGERERYSPEVSYFYKGLGVAAQYLHEDEHYRTSLINNPGGSVLVDVPFKGYYAMATYLLTGEERTTYSMYIEPLHPFDPYHPCVCCGAWELVARVSRLELGRDVFTMYPVVVGGTTRFVSLSDPTLYSRGATEMTLGFNWYLNKWVRMQCNWERSWFDQPVRLGTGPSGLFKRDDAVLGRFQFVF